MQQNESTNVLHHADHRLLVERALDICRQSGLAALSFRSLAEKAEVSVATLQSRFGSKERILEFVFAAAVEADLQRLDAIADQVAPQVRSPGALQTLFRAVVQERSGAGAADQLMLLEMFAAAVRMPVLAPPLRLWLERRQRFWADACRFTEHAEEFGWFLTELQTSLLLTTFCCHRPLETALANDDLIARALGNDPSYEPVWYGRLLAGALEVERTLPTIPTPKGDTLDRLLYAGAEVVAASGVGALSYRNVAAQAALSLSAVTHYFPKRESLIYAVYRRIYEEVAFDAGTPDPIPEDLDARVSRTVEMVMRRRFGGASQPVAHGELYLLAARDPNLADLAWHMRMTRGVYWIKKSNLAFGSADREGFNSHTDAIWGLGSALVHTLCAPPERLEERLRASMLFGFRQLSGMNLPG